MSVWATRAAIHIDRAACAWLIRRSVDPDAVFVFVSDPADVPDAATPFDMRGVRLGHHGPDCSFETILRHYEITDPVLWKIAQIVHEADLDDGRFHAPRGPRPRHRPARTVDDRRRRADPRRHRADLRRTVRVLPPQPATGPHPRLTIPPEPQ
ncbi:chromate resistance protein ChrB domain-containing protein [Catellatospora aurea]|uniref:Chromate resistance protein ChrB domain-containing protein n=1 Tax=Catellatospora aurea TaxID=1337874 RepID=A0ABW2H5D1_9ACTN